MRIAAFALAASLIATAASAQTVRVGYIPVAGSGQIFVVNEEGWAKQAGIDLKLTQFDSGPNMIQALGSGTLDVYVAGVGPLAVARSKGLDIRVVMATATEELAVVASGKFAPRFAGGDAAKAFADFFQAEKRRAKIGTQPAGSVPNVMLQHWLWEVAKVNKDHVEIVPMGIDATQQALLAGAVDAATIREPAITIVADRDKSTKIVATGGQMFPNQPGGVVAFTGDFIKREPKAAQALMNALVRATDMLNKEPAKAAPHIQAALGKGIVDLDTMKRALASPAAKFVSDPRLIVDATAKMQDFQVKIGAIDKAVPLDGLFDPSLFDRTKSGS